jgi:hypothetical protein
LTFPFCVPCDGFGYPSFIGFLTKINKNKNSISEMGFFEILKIPSFSFKQFFLFEKSNFDFF